MAASIKFTIPPEARTFSVFSKFPVEIRQKIWEEAIFEPGMHFLRLESSAPRMPVPNNQEEHDNGQDPTEDSVSTKIWDARLMPLYPTPEADISYYVVLNQLLAKLSVTCPDSDSVVRRLLRRPGTLKLDGGRVVSLGTSSDVICLDYLPPDMFQSGCRMPMDFECPELGLIRHVAVRYCHQWEAKNLASVCLNCGQVHDGATKKIYPVHLYHLLARYLPNLETFHFVDYLITRKPVGAANQMAKGDEHVKRDKPSLSFRSGGRTYHEVDRGAWIIKSEVFDTLSWLQSNFIRYATKSKLAQHGKPRNVQFGVLACEWAPVETAVDGGQALTPKKSLKKRTFAMVEESGGASRRQSARRHLPMDVASRLLPIQASTPFVFGQGRNFDFTFRMDG